MLNLITKKMFDINLHQFNLHTILRFLIEISNSNVLNCYPFVLSLPINKLGFFAKDLLLHSIARCTFCFTQYMELGVISFIPVLTASFSNIYAFFFFESCIKRKKYIFSRRTVKKYNVITSTNIQTVLKRIL